jgi:hypothetical protein
VTAPARGIGRDFTSLAPSLSDDVVRKTLEIQSLRPANQAKPPWAQGLLSHRRNDARSASRPARASRPP